MIQKCVCSKRAPSTPSITHFDVLVADIAKQADAIGVTTGLFKMRLAELKTLLQHFKPAIKRLEKSHYPLSLEMKNLPIIVTVDCKSKVSQTFGEEMKNQTSNFNRKL